MQMDRKKIQLIALPILLIIFSFLVYNYIIRYFMSRQPRDRRPAVRPVPRAPSRPTVSIVPSYGARLEGKDRLEQMRLRAKDIAWGRDPFVLHEGAMDEGMIEIKKLNLMGITLDNRTKSHKAIINDEILTIGSDIGRFKIVDIKRDSVVLSDGENEYQLKISE